MIYCYKTNIRYQCNFKDEQKLIKIVDNSALLNYRLNVNINKEDKEMAIHNSTPNLQAFYMDDWI